MTDKIENIQRFLDSIPDKFDILDVGIDSQTQKEYFEYFQAFERGKLTKKETLGLGNALFDKDESIDKKKRILVLLAHLGTIEAFKQIEKYNNHAENELKQWTLLSLKECKMFLESSLLDENTGFISSGLGGLDNRLNYYFLILSSTDKSFTKTQKKIIRDEFSIVCEELNTILAVINFSKTFVELTVLVPLDVAVGTVIETGIKKCNELGNFVFEHYYVTNENIPEESEIIDIIKIVKGET